MKLIIYISITLTATILAACSDNTDKTTENWQYIAPADSSAYYLGRDNAQAMLLECNTTNDIHDRLLEVRARETSIRTRVGQTAADAYIYGFRTYLTESGDTLATTLF